MLYIVLVVVVVFVIENSIFRAANVLRGSSTQLQVDEYYYNSILPKVFPTSTPKTIVRPNIFVDVGANCGNSYYKIKNRSQEVLKDYESWNTYLWECNPQMINLFLNDLIEEERTIAKNDPKRQHHHIELIEKAASITNGNITFYLTAGQEQYKQGVKPTCDPFSQYSPAAASTIYETAKRASKQTQVNVESVDFTQWFDNLLYGSGGNIDNTTVVALKVDIEGAEKLIFEKMVKEDASNAICRVNILWMEWHHDIFEKDSEEYLSHKKFKETFPTQYQTKCQKRLRIGRWH